MYSMSIPPNISASATSKQQQEKWQEPQWR